MSIILGRVNEVFVTDNLTDQDMINYVHTVADKVAEDTMVMKQIQNNTREQAMLGNFAQAIDDAIIGSHDAHQDQMMQLMTDPMKMNMFANVIYDVLVNKGQMGR